MACLNLSMLRMIAPGREEGSKRGDCQQGRIRRSEGGCFEAKTVSATSSTQKNLMKTLPTECERYSGADDWLTTPGRGIREVELGRDVAKCRLDVQGVDEVPHAADDSLDVRGGGGPLGSDCQCGLVVDEEEKTASLKMTSEDLKSRPDGDDLEGEDLRSSMMKSTAEAGWNVATDPEGGRRRNQDGSEAS